jgi:probable DNA metabolism protein
MDYLYDGSFDGLLSCIYHHYKSKTTSGIYENKLYQYSIMNDYMIIDTNFGFADIVYNAIETKISKEAMNMIFYAFLSCEKDKDNFILKFIEFGFKKGKIALDMYTNDYVLPIREVYTRVSREEHGFLGLLRFSDIGGILYAKYSPDNNLTVLISDHFADRYKYEKFIIHDEKRNIASIYADERWEIIDASKVNTISLSDDELMLQKLWKEYFTTLAIEGRKNTKLQNQKVPKKYRKNIAEFN